MQPFQLLLPLLLLPSLLFGQEETGDSLQNELVPWVSGISAGFSIWPASKERIRAGYSWEEQPNRHWLHEVAYINADQPQLNPDYRYGFLEGAQLRTEYRFYRPYQKRTALYYGVGLAYMYAKHRYSYSEGLNCDTNGACDTFREYRYAVPTHTTTLMATVGILVAAKNWFLVDFFAGLGLRHTYFPLLRTEGYFGRARVLTGTDNMVLEPHVRLGLSMFFVLKHRKELDKDLHNP